MTSSPWAAPQMVTRVWGRHTYIFTLGSLSFQMRFVIDTHKGLIINIHFNNSPSPSRCWRFVVCYFHHVDAGPHFVVTLPPPKTFLCQTLGHSGHSSFYQLNESEGHRGFIVENPQQSTDNVKIFLRISFKRISRWSFHKARRTQWICAHLLKTKYHKIVVSRH